MSLSQGSSVFGATSLALLFACACAPKQPSDTRPNILLIVADDAGYSDVGCYDSEISTPNIDLLASEGLQLTAFHAEPNCSPSRAALLSGDDCHFAGMGAMPSLRTDNQTGKPGYEGHLTDRVRTLSEVLRDDAGYFTCMAGKWHLGHAPGQWPVDRGFDRSFSMLAGGASHWADNTPLIPGKPSPYAEDGKLVEKLPADFYSSRSYADKLIEYIDGAGEKPFFAYLAFTAPHNPLHAPEEDIARQKGRYDEGWEQLQAARFERMQALGLVPAGMTPAPKPEWVMDWASLTPEQRAERARDMEIYAAMIEYLDRSVGRVIDHLAEKGQLENTLVIFVSDNGASRTTIQDYAGLGGELAEYFDSLDNSLQNRGRPGSATDIGPAWAWACSTPLRLTKGYLSQGGIQVPAIIRAPEDLTLDWVSADTPMHMTDIMTIVRTAAGLPAEQPEPDRALCFEFYGMRAVRKGNWKALDLPEPYGNGKWQLYDLAHDPAEQHDLAVEHPEEVAELSAAWDEYAARNGVIIPDRKVFYTLPPRDGSF